MKKILYFIALFPVFLWANIDQFALSLYNQALIHSDTNEIFSPFSLFDGLAMMYLGSLGTTQQEIGSALCIDGPTEDFFISLESLHQDILSTSSVHLANRIWTDPRIQILPSYQERLLFLHASIESLSFNHPAQSCATINQYVSKQTRGEISALLTPQDIAQNTRMILVSALSFEGSWLLPFSVHKTQNDFFYPLSGEAKLTPMMRQEKYFPYYENEKMQLLLMPFQIERFACFIILPKNSLEATTLELQKTSLSDWIQKTELKNISIKIPRFTQKSKYQMVPILSQMGIRKAFSRHANFSLISSDMLNIENLVQEAFFALDESGVSAFAATGIITGITSAANIATPSIAFTANHPFLFGIVDLNSNFMLFLGKIVNL